MEASDKPRPMVIRANTLKTTRKDLMDALSKRGVVVEPVEWSPVAIKVTESAVPIGATPEYLAGHYMLQSAASMNPVMALDPQPGERILDMSCAPGGKTSYIAQLMKNGGTVVANDLKVIRQKATLANLHRMGVKNTIVCSYDGRKIPTVMKGFHRVLLDAPCSGLGVIARDQTVKLQRTLKDIQRNAHLQKELLCAAVDAVDCKAGSAGGVVVYSTCSVSTEENEQVVQYILAKRHVRLVDTGLAVGLPGYTRYRERRFHPTMNLTRRFYPHVHNMDGFFVAKLVKYANGPKLDDEKEEQENEDEAAEEEARGDEGVEADGAELELADSVREGGKGGRTAGSGSEVATRMLEKKNGKNGAGKEGKKREAVEEREDIPVKENENLNQGDVPQVKEKNGHVKRKIKESLMEGKEKEVGKVEKKVAVKREENKPVNNGKKLDLPSIDKSAPDNPSGVNLKDAALGKRRRGDEHLVDKKSNRVVRMEFDLMESSAAVAAKLDTSVIPEVEKVMVAKKSGSVSALEGLRPRLLGKSLKGAAVPPLRRQPLRRGGGRGAGE